MTSVLNFSSTSSCNTAVNLQEDSPSNKFPTTFIVQPPSSSQIKTTNLLGKRSKPAELGDVLMKKIKAQVSSGNNSSEQSPIIKDNFDDAVYDSSEGLECHSAIEEIRSPSIQSCNEDSEKSAEQRIIEESLMPHRSLSTPLIATNFGFNIAKTKTHKNDKQLHNALETLQRKILLDQQALILKGIMKRVQFSQESMRIPALHSDSDFNSTSFNNTTRQELKNLFVRGDDEPEIIIGEVEYPLLSMAPPSIKLDAKPKSSTGVVSNINKVNGLKKGKKAQTKTSNSSSPSYEGTQNAAAALIDSLTVTRAETQRSDSELGSSLREVSEEFAKIIEGKRRKK